MDNLVKNMEEAPKTFDVAIKDKSVVELKAMAYDFGVIIGEYRQMLNLVNQEIVDRMQEKPVNKAS